jgi:hypothetical protein
VKKIAFRVETVSGQPAEFKNILKQVTGNSPVRALTVDEMRKRVKIIDQVEAMGDHRYLILEDSEYDVLKDAVMNFPWAQASKLLVNLIDDIINAESYTHLNVVKKEEEA